eukprot:scaffold1000_cov166-Amphora_coffeaeformis.AAC.38
MTDILDMNCIDCVLGRMPPSCPLTLRSDRNLECGERGVGDGHRRSSKTSIRSYLVYVLYSSTG